MVDDNGGSNRRIKVVRLIDEYGLDSVGAEMEYRWTSEDDDRMSLRELADYFNQKLLAEAMIDAGMKPLSGEVENIYWLLTGDDVSGADRTRARRRLSREGIEVERLEDDFATYQAIRTFLREHRGVEYATDDRPRIEIETENIQKLRGRMVSVIEEKLDQLIKGGHLHLGNSRVLADINVLCADCGSRYDIDELLESGRCNCEV